LDILRIVFLLKTTCRQSVVDYLIQNTYVVLIILIAPPKPKRVEAEHSFKSGQWTTEEEQALFNCPGMMSCLLSHVAPTYELCWEAMDQSLLLK
jgi:ankyrin repeat protein